MRYDGSRETVRAKPHASAAAHQGEAYEKVWDDVTCGRVLLTFADAKGLDGLVSSPQGRVDKMNPDQAISAEGRFVTDMRQLVGLKFTETAGLKS